MTEALTMNETRVLTVADYEARIHLYKEQIGIGYIGIGRTLNEAKESGLVPAGQWEAWMVDVTGLTVRQAQRCMQAAREIKDGSAMARLEMSKAMRLLSSGLDEDQREELAAKASQDELTVKELEAEIRKLKTGFDQAVDQAKQWEERAREAFAEGQKSAERSANVEDNLRVIEAEEKARKKIAMLDEARQAAIDQAQALRKEKNELALRQDELRQRAHELEQRAQHAEEQLKRRQGADQEQYRIGMNAGEEIGRKHAQQELDQLRHRIHEQEQLYREKMQELQQLKAQSRQQQMAQARGVPVQNGPDGVFPYNAERPISEMILLLISKTGAMDPAVYRKDAALAGELIALEKWIERARALIGVDAEGVVE